MAKANLADLGDKFLDQAMPKEEAVVSTKAGIADLTKSSVSHDAVVTLAPFLAIAERVSDALHPAVAPKILGQLSEGFRKAGEYLAIAKYQYQAARNERKRQEAIAFIDEFPKWLRQRKAEGEDVKSTDSIRTHFVAMFPAVLEAKEREAFYEAVQEQLITMKTELFMGISTAKSIAYGYKDHNMLSGVAHNNGTEGKADD
jgi:hypothetical protein